MQKSKLGQAKNVDIYMCTYMYDVGSHTYMYEQNPMPRGKMIAY